MSLRLHTAADHRAASSALKAERLALLRTYANAGLEAARNQVLLIAMGIDIPLRIALLIEDELKTIPQFAEPTTLNPTFLYP